MKLNALMVQKTKNMFPLQRNRRLRVNESIRSLVRETTLSPSDFMFPMFIAEGENVKIEIPSMVGIYRRSIDLTVEEVKELFALGIRAVNIYVKVDESLKDNTGKEAWNENGTKRFFGTQIEVMARFLAPLNHLMNTKILARFLHFRLTTNRFG